MTEKREGANHRGVAYGPCGARYIQYSDAMQETSCAEIVNFSFIGAGNGSMSRGEIVLHVVNHRTYHRGHIGSMIYQVPGEPPTTDLPVFLREHAKEY